MINSLIGRICRHYYKETDFKYEVALLFERIVRRGHEPLKLRNMFAKVALKIRQKGCKFNRKKNTNHANLLQKIITRKDNTAIIFHSTYHPKDISRV